MGRHTKKMPKSVKKNREKNSSKKTYLIAYQRFFPIEGKDEVLKTISGALNTITDKAIGK